MNLSPSAPAARLSSPKSPPSLALLCDPQGMIVEVLRNDLDLPAAPGRLFSRLVDVASQFKALAFLEELRSQAAAFDWELNLVAAPENAGRVLTLHFSGGRWQEEGTRLLLVGAVSNDAARDLLADLLRIHNEQTNQLRDLRKTAAQTGPQMALYDEISRLNNELIAAQRQLARKNAELERLNQLKNQFLGMAAHDLRNPLAAIGAYSELLQDEDLGLSPAERSEFLRDIFRLSRFMNNLVDDLLSVTAIEAGQLQLQLAEVDLTHLVQRNIARHRLLAAHKEIDILLQVGAEDGVSRLPPLWLDAAKIEQVLDNLVSNAVKFSPPRAQVQVRLSAERDAALLAVQDQGPGISPAEIERLFQPFGRGSARGTGGERSTGLGLVIAKRIVEGHQGRIWLTSEAGAGAIFFVSLPLTGTKASP